MATPTTSRSLLLPQCMSSLSFLIHLKYVLHMVPFTDCALIEGSVTLWKLEYGCVTFMLFVQPINARELNKVDPIRACQYFDDCFKDPSTFTVAIVGTIDIEKALPLILQYLVSIFCPTFLLLCYPRCLLSTWLVIVCVVLRNMVLGVKLLWHWSKSEHMPGYKVLLYSPLVGWDSKTSKACDGI